MAISREIKDRKTEGSTLDNLGGMHAHLGQYEKAREYHEQALIISREIKDRHNEGYSLHNLGRIYSKLGQYEKAREYLEQALAIIREIGDRRAEGGTLNSLGETYHSSGEKQKALDFYSQALSVMRAIGDRTREALAHANIALLQRDLGNLSEARSQIEDALNVIESIRTEVAGQEQRATYFASVQNYYEFYIDLLMRLHKQQPEGGHDAAALQASERSRARSLLELLREARADIRQGADSELLARERTLQRQLSDAAKRQTDLLIGKHTDEQAAAIAKEIDTLTGEYQRVEAQIRQSSPRYAALTQPQPLGLGEIQNKVLDSETLLLEYALGQERSFLWAVSPKSITSYELPRRSEIETAARQVYDLMDARNQAASTESNRTVKGETEEQRRLRIYRAVQQAGAHTEAELPAAASRLSLMLLVPAASQLEKKRLVVVADGALHYIPFGALPDPATADHPTATAPLVVNHEVVSLPSASTLAVLRRELEGRKPAAKAVAVLADPVFSKDDTRVEAESSSRGGNKGAGARKEEGTQTISANAPTSSSLVSSDATRAVREVGVVGDGAGIPRLPATRREAEIVLAAAPAGAGMKALDFQANKATAASPELALYRIVHFATHGRLDSEHPELSGVILSLVDEQGRPTDGFLRLHEVYNLKLPAELVVLSACQTALGKEVRGEGLVGLTRGFMYAGAPRVVASLWKVDDAATRELMERFYRGMLKEGLRPAAALRAAQVGMRGSKRWQSPYYWAAFVLQGEWK